MGFEIAVAVAEQPAGSTGNRQDSSGIPRRQHTDQHHHSTGRIEQRSRQH